MKKHLVVAFATWLLLPRAAFADDRTIVYPSTNPVSTQTNLNARLQRLSNGTFIRDALGPSTIAGGVYANLSVVPNGGMSVAVTPTSTTIGPGVLYQLGKLDPTPLPQSQSSTNQLSADLTPIAVNALQTVSVGITSPIVAPAAGSSVYVLVEGQVQTNDTTPYLFHTLTSQGGQGSELVPSLRQDQYVYQLKYGVNAANPAQPTVDTGWIPLSYVLVPSGTTTITQGMITPVTPFSGFAQNGLAGSFSTLKLGNTGAGCLQSDSSGNVHSLTCTSGLGTVVGTSPVTASTQNNIATIGLGHGDYDDILNAQTITGAKTFSQSVAVGGGGNTTPSLTVSNNPSSSSYSPRIYVAQNIAGGGKYGFDSLANQLRVLYTPFANGATETALGYFDTAGAYHVSGSTYGLNAAVSGTLTAGASSLGQTTVGGALTVSNGEALTNDLRLTRTSNAATGAVFFGAPSTQNYLYFDGTTFNFTGPITTTSETIQQGLALGNSAGTYIGINTGFSATSPYIGNSSDGGMNQSIAATSNQGFRWFTDASNGGLTQLEKLDNAGNETLAGSITAGGIYNTIGTSAGNGVLSVPGTGTLYLNLASGGSTVIGNGAGGSSGTHFDPNGTATIANNLTVGGGVSAGTSGISTTGSAVVGGNIQVGPATPNTTSNYITHGQTDTYLYLAGTYSGYTHVEANTINNVGGNGGHYNVTFQNPFSTAPTCTITGSSYAGAIPTTGFVFITGFLGSGNYTGASFQNFFNAAVNVNYICVGH